MATEQDIETLLKKWMDAKQTISELEKKCDNYKKLADKILTTTGKNSITSSLYKLSRRNATREILVKNDVPFDIWNKYCKKITYPMYTIKKN